MKATNSDKESRDCVLQRATRLRQSILQRAFEGKLIAQAAADESPNGLVAKVATEGKAHAN